MDRLPTVVFTFESEVNSERIPATPEIPSFDPCGPQHPDPRRGMVGIRQSVLCGIYTTVRSYLLHRSQRTTIGYR